jgi:hypothetical protein
MMKVVLASADVDRFEPLFPLPAMVVAGPPATF